MSSRITVCHLITGLDTGGAEMMLLKLFAPLRARGFESRVISLTDTGALGHRMQALGVSVTALGMRPGRPTPKGLMRLIRAVRASHPALLQGWMYHGNLAASLVGHFSCPGVPVAWNIRQTVYNLNLEKSLTRWVIRVGAWASRSPSVVLYNSRLARTQHEALGYEQVRGQVIPNGFPLDQFTPSSEASRNLTRAKLGLTAGQVAVGLFARVHPMKDHGNFFAAARQLVALNDRFTFVLAGAGADELNQDIAAWVAQHHLTGRVRLLGEQTDMAALLAAMDIVVLSSSHGEGFPNVLGEAMACGVPCVATDVGDCAHIMGDAGRVVPPRNPDALARAIGELAVLNEQSRRALGRNGRAIVEAKYSLERVADDYATLYRALINSVQQPACVE